MFNRVREMLYNYNMETYKNELFKDIEGQEGRYAISNFGRVWSYRKKNNIPKFLKKDIRNGYYAVKLGKYGKKMSIHRLVALAFIDNPENKEYVNHIDGNKLNNHIDNLEWVTAKENIHHAQINGMIPFKTYPIFRRQKISIEDASEICEAYATGMFTQRELAKKTNLSLGRINQLIHNKWSLK